MGKIITSAKQNGGRQQVPPQPSPRWNPYQPMGPQERRQVNKETEHVLPKLHSDGATVARFLICFVVTGCAVLVGLPLWLLLRRYGLGRWIVCYIAAMFAGGAWLLARHYIPRGYEQVKRAGAGALLAVLLILVGAYSQGVFEIPAEAVLVLASIWCAACILHSTIEPRLKLVVHYLIATIDPGWPAMRMPTDRISPFTGQEEEPEDVTPSELEEIRQQMEQILRHVQAPSPVERIRPVAGNWANGNGRHDDNVRDDPPAVVPARTVVTAPSSGRDVPVEALVTFLEKSGEMGTGARGWKAYWRGEGGEDRWSDVVEIWGRVLGAFEPGRPGVSGYFVVEHDQAMGILDHWLKDDRPTLFEPVQTGQYTPVQTGQDSGTGDREG